MKPISIAIRRRIIALYDQDWSTAQIAAAVGHSESGVRRIRQRYRERQSLEPLPGGSGPPIKASKDDLQRLRDLVDAHRDSTLDELCEMSDLPVSRATIDRYLRKMKYTFKKRHFTRPSSIALM